MAFTMYPSDEFLERFLCWIRLEPRCRAESQVQKGLEACVADPLWMLARQWQMGEFKAEDNGSPIAATIQYTTKKLNQVRFGKEAQSIVLNDSSPPLETIVEAEPHFKDPEKIGPDELDWRTRVQIGQQFERILQKDVSDKADKIIQILRKELAIREPDEEQCKIYDYKTQRFLRLMAGRAIDGGEVLKRLKKEDHIPIANLSPKNQVVYDNAYNRLADWFYNLYGQPARQGNQAWRQQDLNYQFSLQAKSPDQTVELEATDYRNGDLEWYAVDFKQATSTRPQRITGPVSTETTTPMRIGYAGKPSERWWAFEDYQVNLVAHNAATTDLARLLLTEFSIAYADDWFFVPLELPLGCLAEIKVLSVKNVFGDIFKIDPAFHAGETESSRWELFTHTCLDDYAQTLAGALLIPPSFGDREESAPLEEVNFIRDEMANMVFAIERTVCNRLGHPQNGFEAQLERRQRNIFQQGPDAERQEAVSDDIKLRYRLATTVPDNWIPYISVSSGNGGMVLKQARMPGSRNSPIEPMSRILRTHRQNEGSDGYLHEESVPRAGVRVLLTAQRVRGCDGSTHAWLGRKVLTGRGEGNSGLKFDTLMHVTPSTKTD